MRFRILFFIGVLVLCGSAIGQQTEQIYIDHRSTAFASPPGTTTGETPSNTNYADLFAAALQSFSDSGGQAVTVDYKLPDGIFGKALASKLQLAAKKPELNSKFLTHLNNDTAVITRLKDELQLGDDLTFTFLISPLEKRNQEKVRNDFKQNQGQLFDAEFEAQVAKLPEPRQPGIRSMRTAANDLDRAAADSPQATGDDFEFLDRKLSGENGALRQLRSEGIARKMARAENATAVTQPDAVFDLLRLEEAATMDLAADMGNLAANQSKFNLQASYRNQRETAGADEWFLKTSYEYGVGTNVEKRTQQILEACVAEGSPCPKTAKSKAIRDLATSRPVQTGRRFTFALEYHNYSSIDLPDYTFKLPGSKSLVASLTGGVDVFGSAEVKKDKMRTGRVELSAAYDDVSGDKNRKDRLIATLTYSQRISEDFYFPVSLVYASHDDYLSNVDRKFNAHFGISYKLQNKAKKP